MNKQALQHISDGLDFGAVCFMSIQQRREDEGELLTIPASLMVMMIQQLSGHLAQAMNALDPDALLKYGVEAEARVLARVTAAQMEVEQMPEEVRAALQESLTITKPKH